MISATQHRIKKKRRAAALLLRFLRDTRGERTKIKAVVQVGQLLALLLASFPTSGTCHWLLGAVCCCALSVLPAVCADAD